MTSNGGESPVSVGIVWNKTNTWDTGQAPNNQPDPETQDVPMGSVVDGPFVGLVDLTGVTLEVDGGRCI